MKNPSAFIALTDFIKKIQAGQKVSFQETMTVIAENYQYRPTQFINGYGADILINEAGSNEGSCKIFAFAKINRLNRQQTLSLFGDYYWQDVLKNPEGEGHQNIRNFMRYGWQGIAFAGESLTPKT